MAHPARNNEAPSGTETPGTGGSYALLWKHPHGRRTRIPGIVRLAPLDPRLLSADRREDSPSRSSWTLPAF